MSVQQVISNSNYTSTAPLIICPGNGLLSFQTSGSIVSNKDVDAGFIQQNSTLWSYYWNDSVQNTYSQNTNGVQKLQLFC